MIYVENENDLVDNGDHYELRGDRSFSIGTVQGKTGTIVVVQKMLESFTGAMNIKLYKCGVLSISKVKMDSGIYQALVQERSNIIIPKVKEEIVEQAKG